MANIIDMPARIPEHTTRGGATRLAERIRAYWACKGFNIRVWTEEEFGIWAVRSDMIDGRPRSYTHTPGRA